MSEIRANTVSNAAGTGPVTLTGQSAAKQWVSFNGSGTLAVRDSFNTSSVTDNNTGDYSSNFSSAMSDANYTMTAAAGGVSGAFSTSVSVANFLSQPTASSVRMVSYYGTGAADCSHVNSAVLGDLA